VSFASAAGLKDFEVTEKLLAIAKNRDFTNITKAQVEKVGLSWEDVSRKLVENGWAKQINLSEVHFDEINKIGIPDQFYVDYPGLASNLRLLSEKQRICANAVRVLGLIADPNTIDLLISFVDIKNNPAEIRDAAAMTFYNFQDPRVEQCLITALKDPDKEVKKSAAQSLYRIKSIKAIEPLIEILGKDEDEEVRFFVGDSLNKITAKSFGIDYEQWLKWRKEYNINSIGK
jgi:hypothetical protein